jgi:hypothetical protein
MGNPATLQPNVFSSTNQPAPEKKSRKGIPNRATVYKRILETKVEVPMPDKTKKKMTLYEAIALGQAQSAMKGNTNAWKEIQDTLHGKMADKTEHSGKVELEVATFQIKTRNNEE